jgi:hypothetical protein
MLLPFKILKTHPSVVSESERKIERHLDTAYLYHSKAMSLLYEGKYEKAAQNALLAQKHLDIASKAKREEQQMEI